MSDLLSISEVATQLDISPHTLRYYEKAGLLQVVQRTSGNARRYPPEAVELIRLLLKLRETGMPIARVREYTDLIMDGEHTVPARRDILQHHRDSLQSQIESLTNCLEIVDAKLAIYEAGCSMEDKNHPAVKKLTCLLNGKQK